VFPAAALSVDPRSGIERRHHTHEQALQRAIKRGLGAAGIAKPTTMIYTHVLNRGGRGVVSPLDTVR
jgi:hypothetical protein